jgi:hypothetical protein
MRFASAASQEETQVNASNELVRCFRGAEGQDPQATWHVLAQLTGAKTSNMNEQWMRWQLGISVSP